MTRPMSPRLQFGAAETTQTDDLQSSAANDDVAQQLLKCSDKSGAPPSDYSVSDLLNELNQLTSLCPILDSNAATPAKKALEAAADPPAPLTPLEEEAKAAADGDGKFELRKTALGREWYLQLKNDQQLQADYGKKKGYEAQREFRTQMVEAVVGQDRPSAHREQELR